MRAQSTSKVMNAPINDFLSRTGIMKKDIAKEMFVTGQTITDWTRESHPKPVTAENAVRLAEVTNDSRLAQTIGYFYLGLPRPLDGEYKLDLSYLDDLREIEEDERDERQQDRQVRRILCKRGELNVESYDLVLDLAREQAEACIVNQQYLFALCERLNISVMDLMDMYMDRWKAEGYFGKEL